MQPQIRFSNNLIMAMGIILVGLLAVMDMVMFLMLSGSTQQAIAVLYSAINISYQPPVNLTPLYDRLASDEAMLFEAKNRPVPEDKSAEIAALRSEITSLRGSLENITAYIQGMNFTNITINNTVVYNNTIQIPVTETCREHIIQAYGLGPLFDVVACCELRNYGFADECCACYRS